MGRKTKSIYYEMEGKCHCLPRAATVGAAQ